MPLVGFILIAMALFAVGGTLYMVMREHQETEQWYIPPDADELAHQDKDESNGAAIAEIVGVPEADASTGIDEEAKRQASEND